MLEAVNEDMSHETCARVGLERRFLPSSNFGDEAAGPFAFDLLPFVPGSSSDRLHDVERAFEVVGDGG